MSEQSLIGERSGKTQKRPEAQGNSRCRSGVICGSRDWSRSHIGHFVGGWCRRGHAVHLFQNEGRFTERTVPRDAERDRPGDGRFSVLRGCSYAASVCVGPVSEFGGGASEAAQGAAAAALIGKAAEGCGSAEHGD